MKAPLLSFDVLRAPKTVELILTFLRHPDRDPVVMELFPINHPPYQRAAERAISDDPEVQKHHARQQLYAAGAKKLPGALKPTSVKKVFEKPFGERREIDTLVLLIKDVKGLMGEDGEPMAYTEEVGRWMLAQEALVRSDVVERQMRQFEEVELECYKALVANEDGEVLYPRMMAGALLARAIRAAASELGAAHEQEEHETVEALDPTSSGGQSGTQPRRGKNAKTPSTT